MRAAAAATLLLACAACTHFVHPLVDEAGPALDPALVGSWVLENDEARYEIEIQPQRKGGHLHFVSAQPPAAEEESADLHLVTVRIGDLDYGSARPVEKPAEGWTPFRYELKGDELTVILSNTDYWVKAIRARLVPGKIRKTDAVETAFVTASSSQLRALVAKHGAEIFPAEADPELLLRRLPRAAPSN